MDIWIRDFNATSWTRPAPALRDAYVNYKEREHYYREVPFITGAYIVYRPENDPYLPTYIAHVDDVYATATAATTQDARHDSDEDDTGSGATGSGHHLTVRQNVHDRLTTALPIIDMNDVYAFIVSNSATLRSNWMPCRNYQAWAYRDFVYDLNHSIKKSYMSPYSSYLVFNSSILVNQMVTIDLPDLPPNIVFNVSRNNNNSVFFERNDAQGSRVRMCDNEYARAGYLGYYTRITMDIGIVVVPPSSLNMHPTNLLSTDHLYPQQETNDETAQCILCNT